MTPFGPILWPALATVALAVGGTALVVAYAQYLRHGFHFRLHTLLIATTIVALALGLWAWAAR